MLHSVDASRLILYRTFLPNDGELEKKLQYLKFNESLQPTSILGEIFTDPPVEGYVETVVRSPLQVLEEAGIHEEKDHILMEMNKLLKRTLTPSEFPPSTMAQSTSYAVNQGGDHQLLDCRCTSQGRDTVAPPVQLFNPAFAYFTSKAFDAEHAVPYAFTRDVRDLVQSSAVIHGSEAESRDYLKPVIQKIIGYPPLLLSDFDSTAPGGMVAIPHGRTDYLPIVIYEEQNELGDGESDPSTQAAFSYQHIFGQKDTHALALTTCCPAFIIARAGPWLTILGGIITTKCIVQRLTDFLWLPVHCTHDDDHLFRIARIFYVLKESIGQLHSWFREGGVEVQFRYQQPLEDTDTCVTYLAQTFGPCPKDIVVKFITRYGGDAHRTMADAGFAPKLRYFGPIGTGEDAVSYGKLKMVVMDYVEGMTLFNALKERAVPANFPTHLRQAIAYLHGAGFVFGDLREPNIMVTPRNKFTPVLIDFDWAGKDGEVLYPASNLSDIPWSTARIISKLETDDRMEF
ncbi:hypothetical protein EDC04DRAFT_672629 [Pisolithus marmoratus]|nr:hypothetical protein EDC04DRAFT_672629 [Pisolithus marmoratus]